MGGKGKNFAFCRKSRQPPRSSGGAHPPPPPPPLFFFFFFFFRNQPSTGSHLPAGNSQRSARPPGRWPSIHRCRPPAGWFCPRVRARRERQCSRIRLERTKTPAAAFLMAGRYKLTGEPKKSHRRRFNAFWWHRGFLPLASIQPLPVILRCRPAGRRACLPAARPPVAGHPLLASPSVGQRVPVASCCRSSLVGYLTASTAW